VIQYPLSVGGTLTRVLEAGMGEETIVFLHGLGARADRWRGTVERFAAKGFRCFAIDLPGHGLAAKGDGFAYGVPGYARFLTDCLDTLGLDRVHLVGTSLGGHISAYFTIRHTTRVKSLTLVGTTGIVPIGPDVGRAIRDNIRITSYDGIRTKLKFVLGDADLVTDEFVLEEFRINNSPGAETAFARLGDYIAEEIDGDVVGPALRDLTDRPPMLLVWGEIDRAVPMSVGHSVRDMFPGIDFVVVPDAGHAPYFERPAAFDLALTTFLSGPAIG
jgi:2-hydroxy-6-oxonona-2,4-dienedioate hydrolase